MEKGNNEAENNKNFEVSVGKIITGVLAIVSCIIVFFFNIREFIYIRYWGQYSCAALIISIIIVLILIATLIIAIFNILIILKKEDRRTVSLVTVILEAVASLFIFLYLLIYGIVLTVKDRYLFDFPVLQFVALVLCIGLMIGCFICNKKFPAVKSKTNSDAIGNEQAGQSDGYYSLTTHVLLMIFIGWIWRLIWVHRVTKYLNFRSDFNRNPATTVVLCLFVPFYSIYWTYKASQEIDGSVRLTVLTRLPQFALYASFSYR